MKRILRSENGSALLMVVGTLSAVMLVGLLALSKTTSQSLTGRTGGARVEANAYLQSIQQVMSSKEACTQNLNNLPKGTTFTYTPNPQASTAPPANATFSQISVPSSGSNSTVLAGLVGQQNQLSNLVTPMNPYIDFTQSNFFYYGQQAASAPTGIAGYYCFSATLHADVDLETQTTGTLSVNGTDSYYGPRRTIGAKSIGADFPLVLTTDASGNPKSCFVGEASQFCSPPGPPEITSWVVIPASPTCNDPWATHAFTIDFTLVNSSSATMTCTTTSGVVYPAPNNPQTYTTNGAQTYSGTIPDFAPNGDFSNCTLIATNPGGSVQQTVTAAQLNYNRDCTADFLTLAGPSCVNPGATFSMNWTDSNTSDEDPIDQITVTFNGTPLNSPWNATGSGTAGLFTAPTTSGPYSATATSNNPRTPAGSGSNTAPATVTVSASPTVSSFSYNPSPVTSDMLPATVNLTWATGGVGASGVTITNTSTGVIVGTGLPASGSQAVTIPVGTAGPVVYSLTGTGSCTTSSISASQTLSIPISACSCVVANETTTPLGHPSIDSCGTANPSCLGTAPPAGSYSCKTFSCPGGTTVTGTYTSTTFSSASCGLPPTPGSCALACYSMGLTENPCGPQSGCIGGTPEGSYNQYSDCQDPSFTGINGQCCCNTIPIQAVTCTPS